MLEISLLGRIPSKKNSKQIIYVKKRPVLIPSKLHKAWHEEQSLYLNLKRYPLMENVRSVYITIFAPDKRKSDLTNKVESIMDLLVDNGIIEDDNWFIVPEVVLKFGGVDRKHPRAEVVIYGKNNTTRSGD